MSRFPVLFVLLTLFSPLTFAQALEVCSSSAADPDGDGFGWENSASCVVTNESDTKPVITNLETGRSVQLTRAYWDGLADFDDPILCTKWVFDDSSYVRQTVDYLEFSPLSETEPYQGTVTIGFSRAPLGLWSVENGIYRGPRYLSQSPWVEIVGFNRNGFATEGVRSWISDNEFELCYRVEPTLSFIPTGRPPSGNGFLSGVCTDTDPVGDGWGWDGSVSCRVSRNTPPPVTVQCSSAAADTDNDGFGWENNASCVVTENSSVVPQFTNLETGQSIQLTRAYWDGNVDFNKPVNCSSYKWNGGPYYQRDQLSLDLDFDPLPTQAPFESMVDLQAVGTNLVYSDTQTWGVDNGIYSGPAAIGRSPWVQIVNSGTGRENAVRVWFSNETFDLCISLLDETDVFAPSGAPLQTNPYSDGRCIDTNPIGDGWGWDGATSCTIEGPVTASTCHDTAPVGDGWGWDGLASCRIL